MRRIIFLLTLLGLSVVIATMHLLAIVHLWYFYYAWYDIVVHFLGGALIGTAAGGLAFGIFGKPGGVKYRLLFIVATVLLFGLLWEWFELVAGVQREVFYYFDTSLDVLMDLLGGVFAAFMLLFAYGRRRESTE